MMKKKHKSNAAFLKDLFHHLEGDVKGFKEEIKEDKELIRSAKKKYSPRKVERHLKDDIKYYGREAKQDKALLKKMCVSCKKKRK